MDTEYNSCLYFSANSLSRALSVMADEAFGKIGLAPSYAFLLMTVNKMPGIQPSEISEILGLTPSTITRLVDKMEYRGYLTRDSEGRATYIRPTEKCREQDAGIRKAWRELREKYTGLLGDRYTEVLTEMSSKAVEQLDEV